MATMKVLVVDDEQVVRDNLSRKLRREGFTAYTGGNGLEGLRLFHAERPDLVVIDIVMPEMDGLTVCQRIREVAETPIMMLSANAIDEEDIIRGLNAGADEYIIKPVRLDEFVARVRALLRRAQMIGSEDSDRSYSDGYLSVDLKRRQVHVNGEKVHLTPTEFKLLSVLLENSGRVVTQRELLEQVWGQEYVEDLYYPRVYISQLRRKIEPDAANPTYVLTEHRVGYRFEKQAG